jgi:hypothetical protein
MLLIHRYHSIVNRPISGDAPSKYLLNDETNCQSIQTAYFEVKPVHRRIHNDRRR